MVYVGIVCLLAFIVYFLAYLHLHRFVYEKQHITVWLKNHNTSPMTNLPLQNTNLIECVPMRKLIRDWADKHQAPLT